MKKKAYCIGNAAYPDSPLDNAMNDATDIATHLRSLGFTCRLLRDATARSMSDVLNQFKEDLIDTDVGLFFFAGHGMQIEGENYLTAIDTSFDSEESVKYSSLPLNMVIDILEKGANETSIIILDACRNNPYERKVRGIGTRGLAPVYAPKGTIIAFATSPGQAAFDGHGKNGVFTGALLNHIGTQNITIEDLFKRVRNTVSAATSGKQTSWEHTSLMGDFFFSPSIVNGDFLVNYSDEARADSKYDVTRSGNIYSNIRDLKSHDWYTQNPALTAITPESIADADKDSLFVLGRNILQCADGDAKAADRILSGIGGYLAKYDREVAFHIYNGMLYEVYFDSDDRFRILKKAKKLDELLSIESNAAYHSSIEFIQQALIPFQKQLFYTPGSGRTVQVDIQVSKSGDESVSINSIFVEGQDVFYSNDGKTLIVNSEDVYYLRMMPEQFIVKVYAEMAVPSRRGKITFVPSLPEGAILNVPHQYFIRRLSK